jgi:TonB family protein
MRILRNLWLVFVLGACLDGAVLAQCHAPTAAVNAEPGSVLASEGSAAEPRGEEDRTVLVDLVLRKSGAVREASAIKGPTALYPAAIKAVKRQNYKSHMNVWPFDKQITVEIRFPKDKGAAPEIRQVMPGGIPSCIHVGTVRISAEVMQSRLVTHIEPAIPAEEQQVEGTLVLWLRVDKDGNVYKAEKVSGPDALDAPVVEAVKQWKYTPFVLNGNPVEVETTVEFKFPR